MKGAEGIIARLDEELEELQERNKALVDEICLMSKDNLLNEFTSKIYRDGLQVVLKDKKTGINVRGIASMALVNGDNLFASGHDGLIGKEDAAGNVIK